MGWGWGVLYVHCGDYLLYESAVVCRDEVGDEVEGREEGEV